MHVIKDKDWMSSEFRTIKKHLVAKWEYDFKSKEWTIYEVKM